ncbi:hypothetical protein K438DRAFT_772947 [Mycena galopus ATCC 62051]|nr:hypothetical protein K438DRAFT_772947 [Mycena galopus ATCC 62051]
MFFMLILIHLLFQDSHAIPLSPPLDARTSTDSCNDINNCRQLFDIIWGCLATIFACTWVSVHPNVPPLDQSSLALLGRRLKMMLIAIIAPEIMVGFAARQYFGARELSTEFGFSRTHGFFFSMGGFVSPAGKPIATKQQLSDCIDFQKAIQNINVEDILDKSKADTLSKGVALAQGLWFTTQCLARMYQHLAITELEVATMAFAVVNVFIWFLWWDKPLDVQRPIVILSRTPQPIIHVQQTSLSSRFWGAIFGWTMNINEHPLSSNSVPSFWSLPLNNDKIKFIPMGAFALTVLTGSVFGAIHFAAWNSGFPTTAEMWIWRSCSSVITGIPCVVFLCAWLGYAVRGTQFKGTMLDRILSAIVEVAMLWGIPIYISARLILIILPLMALRAPPPTAFVDVNWSTYIPHF